MIRTIIIDDEPLAIESLELILKKKCREDVQVIASTNSPQMGKSLIEKHKPDLVYLDVEMPHDDYFKLLKVMSEVGLVEEGYYQASVNQQSSIQ